MLPEVTGQSVFESIVDLQKFQIFFFVEIWASYLLVILTTRIEKRERRVFLHHLLRRWIVILVIGTLGTKVRETFCMRSTPKSYMVVGLYNVWTTGSSTRYGVISRKNNHYCYALILTELGFRAVNPVLLSLYHTVRRCNSYSCVSNDYNQ